MNNIAKSFRTFAEVFAKVANNYLHMPILNNHLFSYSNNQLDTFNNDFFINIPHEINLGSLTWGKLTDGNNIKDQNELGVIFGYNLENEKYRKLKIGWNKARKKFHEDGEKGFSLFTFMASEKKGSKLFRRILTKTPKKVVEKNIKQMSQVKTFLRLTETNELETIRTKSMLGAWNNFFLQGAIRTFLFKFYNNTLGINSRVAKFVPETDPSCTFCSILNLRPSPKESFTHLFYFCPTTNSIVKEFFARYFTIPVPDGSIFFCGNLSIKEEENKSFQLVMDILRYYIWCNKLEKKIPVMANIFVEINNTMGTIYKMSGKTKNYAEQCNFFRHGGE